jgi:hypothetical protein
MLEYWDEFFKSLEEDVEIGFIDCKMFVGIC